MNTLQLIAMSNVLLNKNVQNEYDKLPNTYKNMLLNYKSEDEILCDIFDQIKLNDNNIKYYERFPVLGKFLYTFNKTDYSEIFLFNLIKLYNLNREIHKLSNIWIKISKVDNISLDFIRIFKDYIDWTTIIRRNKIPSNIFYDIMYQYKNEIQIWYDYYNI